jgi:hypothetical protein
MTAEAKERAALVLSNGMVGLRVGQ